MVVDTLQESEPLKNIIKQIFISEERRFVTRANLLVILWLLSSIRLLKQQYPLAMIIDKCRKLFRQGTPDLSIQIHKFCHANVYKMFSSSRSCIRRKDENWQWYRSYQVAEWLEKCGGFWMPVKIDVTIPVQKEGSYLMTYGRKTVDQMQNRRPYVIAKNIHAYGRDRWYFIDPWQQLGLLVAENEEWVWLRKSSEQRQPAMAT